MKNILRSIFLVLFVTLFNASGMAIPPASQEQGMSISSQVQPGLSTLRLKDFQKRIGRKLTVKEKIGFLILKQKLKQEPGDPAEAGSKKGNTSLILGIIAASCILLTAIFPVLFLATLPCAILAIVFGNQVKKINPSNKRAKAGVILGWVSLGLFVLIIGLIILFIISFGVII